MKNTPVSRATGGALSRRGFLSAAVLTAAAAAVSGCTSAVSAARTRNSQGASGGVLVIGSLTDIDPKSIYSQSITTMTVGQLLWDSLIRYDRETLEPTPALATAWQLTEDGTEVTLNLRDDVTFHTGRPFTSADVAYSLAL